MTKALRRYWFKFRSIPPGVLRLGCGITAYTHDDAVNILRETVFRDRELPEIEAITEDVDIRTLDQKHIIPNMEACSWRGVWFPRGYELPPTV